MLIFLCFLFIYHEQQQDRLSSKRIAGGSEKNRTRPVGFRLLAPVAELEHFIWGGAGGGQKNLQGWQIRTENLRLLKAKCDTVGDVFQVNVERKYPVYFTLHGEGVDEEPEGVLSIDRKTGTIYANKAVDYEERTRLKVRLSFLSDHTLIDGLWILNFLKYASRMITFFL